MASRNISWLVSGLALSLACGGDGDAPNFDKADDSVTGVSDGGVPNSEGPIQVAPNPGKDSGGLPDGKGDDGEGFLGDAGSDPGTSVPVDAGSEVDAAAPTWVDASTDVDAGVERDAGGEVPPEDAGEPGEEPTPVHHKLELSLQGEGDGSVVGRVAGRDTLTCTRAQEACFASLREGTEIVLSAEPAYDSTFAWGGACAGVRGPSCTLTVSGSKRVSVSFDLKDFTLSVTVSGTGNGQPGRGSVVSEPEGISCTTQGAPATCSAPFPARTYVRLRAIPDSPGNSNQVTFGGWGGACESNGQNQLCEIVLGGDTEVSAKFVR